ncbi:prolyl oligopeptidase family serine peptidase [Methanolobus sediminis]|uniref:Prolyl oligopeptidase family serine peptidase n=1 Tax=Methanolobus sediminis TaxID=3072978 RepID=A0AA51ULV7_9EURY|nr:alpha/beta fold hydrolase [Methanolobus sediminis]WMW25729.1 prolyl oligopeptidase family serine peptidase [Methanolobus sediminis]
MSQKHTAKGKRKTETEQRKMNVKLLPLALGILLMAAGAFGIMHSSNNDENWSVSDDGILSFPVIKNIDYSSNDISAANDADIIREVSFESSGSQIAGLIRIPESGTNVPGVVILPGAGVSKEQQTAVPQLLSSLGYASITIDQRNLGGIDPQGDLALYMNGTEPVEYMMVHDALAAANVLADQSEVNEDNIAMLGLSNGGRFAIIATAIEPGIKGVIGISTSGYDTDSIELNDNINMDAYKFYRSIDPDNYLDMISSRRFVMLHSMNDSTIPYEYALRTFDKAEEPKALYPINGSTHGYSPLMAEDIENELGIIFE